MVFKTIFSNLLLVSLFLFVSCVQEDEFFEKANLEGTNVDKTIDTEGEIVIPDPTIEPTIVPTIEPTIVPTIEPTPVSTIEPTPVSTIEPTIVPTIEPTPVPTIEPTIVPTIEPTPVPTIEPTPVPTIEPTPVPTIEPTPVPTITLELRTETFTQNSNDEAGKVDILWVVDNSGSMSDEQLALARNFQFFINEFIQKNVNFKMGITTTDTTSAYKGQMTCGTYRKQGYGDKTLICDNNKSNVSSDELVERLSSNAAANNINDFIDDFMNFIYVGYIGSGIEKGFLATQSFLNSYTTFLRNDAYLAVIVLSDEQDQSSGSVQSYVDFIRSKKTNAGFAKIYSIITTVNESGVTRGTRYMEASTMTGGSWHNIKEDFYDILVDIGGKIVELINNFSISESPYNNEITVSVNGQVVTSGWSYNINSRTVIFAENSIPVEGSTIVITYNVQI